MGSNDPYDQYYTDLLNALNKSSHFFPRLLGKTEWLERTFPNLLYRIGPTVNLLNQLSPDMIRYTPVSQAAKIMTVVRDMVDLLYAIDIFEPPLHIPPQQQIEEMTARFDRLEPNLFQWIPPILATHMAATRQAGLVNIKEEATQSANEIKRILAEAETILSSIQTAAASIGTTKYATIFNDEYKDYRKQSRWWFGTSAILVVIGIIVIVWLHLILPFDAGSAASVIRYTSTKILVLSMLYIVLAITIRNFSASKHNAVINRHRACALTTFEAFAEAARSDETKDIILRQATEAIFTMQRTGFIGKETPPMPSRQVTEILSTLSKKNG